MPDFGLVVFEETSSLINPVRRYDMTIVLCAIFFVSGASSLVFENLWFRQAGLAFGNSVWASSLVLSLLGHPLEKSTSDLHRVLTRSTLTAPALWYMGSSSDAQRVLNSLDPAQRYTPVMRYHETVGMISERRYAAAGEPLRQAEGNPNLFLTARVFRIYMSRLAGRQDEARRLASATRPTPVDRPRVADWWEFLHETCGIDSQWPRSEDP